jgi:ABC-type transport system involved in multi-copper enzyme maturation permease subunit
MPVFEQGYQSYDGTRHPLKVRWWPLFREEVVPFLKRRIFIFLLILGALPWTVAIAFTFLHTQLGDSESARQLVGKLPQVDEDLFSAFLSNFYNLFLLLLVVIWVGSGLIARDRKEGTLEVILGRAVSPLQYLWAKGAALGAFLLIFSLVPVFIVVVFQVGLTGDIAWLWEHARVLWGTLLYTLVGPGSLVLFILALSSLGRSPRLVGLTLFGVAFVGPIACGILYAITKSYWAWFPSLLNQLKALSHHCLGASHEESTAIPLPITLTFFILLSAGSVLLLTWRFSRKGVLR